VDDTLRRPPTSPVLGLDDADVAVSLTPCPSFTQWLDRQSESLYLNCDDVKRIDPGQEVEYAMPVALHCQPLSFHSQIGVLSTAVHVSPHTTCKATVE
jgi:hypothetical protein